MFQVATMVLLNKVTLVFLKSLCYLSISIFLGHSPGAVKNGSCTFGWYALSGKS